MQDALTFLEASDTLPLVDVYFVADRGTMYDPDGREGALNVALRSIRRGTRRLSGPEIDAALDRLGAELTFTGDTTSTTLHAAVIRRNLPQLLDLLAEILETPTFPAREVEQVMREVRADLIEARDDDRILAARWFRRTLFKGHPFGRPDAGTPKSLDAVNRDDVVAAWRGAATGSLRLFAAAGDITEAELNGFRDQVVGRLARVDVTPRTLPEPAAPRGRTLVIVDKPARTQTQIYIGGLGTMPRDRDHFALLVGNTIFGGTFTSRLMREVRSKRGWSYGAASRLGRDRVREAWSMWTHPAMSDAPACIALELKLLDKLLDDGVTERELSFAKSYLVRSRAFDLDTATKRLWTRIDQHLLGLPSNFQARAAERIMAVTRDEVNAALRKRLSSKNLIVSVLATASEARAAIEDAIDGLDRTVVIPYESD